MRRFNLDVLPITPQEMGVQRAKAINERLPSPHVMFYGLASAGGVIGYAPLLTLLLPIKLGGFADSVRYEVLELCGVAGAIAAGLANIVFGWLGDRSSARGKGRRGWLLFGAIATVLSFAIIVFAREAGAIIASIVLFQIAINAVLAQVGALIAEEVPAAQKGTAAGLLALGNPLAAGASAIVVVAAAAEGARLAIVAFLMIGCMLPLMLARNRPIARAVVDAPVRMAMRRDLFGAWVARLLMQIAQQGVGLFLFFYFEGLAQGNTDLPTHVSRLLLIATIVPAPVALLLGRWSDRIGSRSPFLTGAAILSTLGVAGMAAAQSWTVGAISYVAFAAGGATFLALNIGDAMLLLPAGAKPGRDLGLLNLANTIPQIIAPLLAWWSGAAHGFGTALSVLTVVTLLAGLLPLMGGTWTDGAPAPAQESDRGMQVDRTTRS